MRRTLLGVLAGIAIGVLVVLVSGVDGWPGTDWPIMPVMGKAEAVVNVLILAVIGGAVGWAER